MIGTYDPNFPPQLSTDSRFLNEKEIICPDCNDKMMDISECCGAKIDSDYLVCYKCKEHSDIAICETCLGKGTIII